MKVREQRRKVFLPARMRHGTYWGDVRICNISSRGLLLQADEPPSKGAYVEIRRGPHIVIGRAVWQHGKSVGVRTQDRIDVDAIVGLAPAPRTTATDRRAMPRPAGPTAATVAQSAERNRAWASALQFALFAAIGLAVAGLIASTLYDLLGRPFAAIEAQMHGVG